MFKLNMKDKRILYELDVNARQSFSQIARKVKLSKEVVRYRINNLIKNKIIFGFLLVADSKKLGLFYSKVFVNLQNTSEEIEKKLLNYLIRNKKVTAVFECDGRFDLFFSIVSRNVEELNETLIDLENKFGKYFNEKIVNMILEGHYFYKDYLINKKQSFERKLVGFGLDKEFSKVDDVDKKILLGLAENPRVSLMELSKRLSYSIDGINLRIRKLEKRGIIQNYILILNNKEIGQLHYKVLLDLKNFTNNSEKDLLKFCEQHPNIYYVCKTLTPWKFEIDIEVLGIEEYKKILREIKMKFNNIIKETISLRVSNIEKYNLLPSLE